MGAIQDNTQREPCGHFASGLVEWAKTGRRRGRGQTSETPGEEGTTLSRFRWMTVGEGIQVGKGVPEAGRDMSSGHLSTMIGKLIFIKVFEWPFVGQGMLKRDFQNSEWIVGRGELATMGPTGDLSRKMNKISSGRRRKETILVQGNSDCKRTEASQYGLY